jgi:NAD dependent epimerase/dehydratase family enzyme
VPVPAFALRLALGEAASALLSGQRVEPRRTQALGFRFAFPALDPALAGLVGR